MRQHQARRIAAAALIVAYFALAVAAIVQAQ